METALNLFIKNVQNESNKERRKAKNCYIFPHKRAHLLQPLKRIYNEINLSKRYMYVLLDQ